MSFTQRVRTCPLAAKAHQLTSFCICIRAGMDLVRKIEALSTDDKDKPASDVEIVDCGELPSEEVRAEH